MRVWPAPIDVQSPDGASWTVRVRRPGDRKLRWRPPGSPEGLFQGFNGGFGDTGSGIEGLLILILIVLVAIVVLLIAWFVLIPLLLLLGEFLIVVVIGAVAAVAARLIRLPLVVEALGPDGDRITMPARGLRDAERKAVELADRIEREEPRPARSVRRIQATEG
jgi:hypothetical protein